MSSPEFIRHELNDLIASLISERLSADQKRRIRERVAHLRIELKKYYETPPTK